MICTKPKNFHVEAGVSHELAKERKSKISNVIYKLQFNIPAEKNEKVTGKATISFTLADKPQDVILDFQNNTKQILSVEANAEKINYWSDTEHIMIPKIFCKKGKNEVKIEFISGDASLNRHKNFLYTLFVPDKASIVFPCFDQPDIKANFELELVIPKDWTALSNGRILEDTVKNQSRYLKFKQTKVISTYHFAFTAGKFQKLQKTKNGRTINFYHIEPNIKLVEKNADILFDMHFRSVEFMENYTGIKYPFDKLDFVTIPSFQFSGMEHVGAIYYRSSRLFMSASSSLEEIIKRASVIAHEVSHMWFGDLVTMKWFDDVWLKEVYAELFAAKIVHPMFPNMNHDLNFVTANYPRAYQTDRSAGTHAIQQELDNLKFAGTLYDDIIYFKSPIVMANLEQLIGEKAMQDGLREYLEKYSYGNAEWQDLIDIFDKHTKFNLDEWSKMWVMQKGMPTINADIEYSDNKITKFTLHQNDPFGENRFWKQNLRILLFKNGKSKELPIYFDKQKMEISEAIGCEKPDFVLINGGAYGYGYFVLNEDDKEFLLQNVSTIKDDLVRTSVYITMFQAVVNYNLDVATYIQAMLKALETEKIKQNIQLILNYIEISWWFFTDENIKAKYALDFEKALINKSETTDANEIKSAIFDVLLSVFMSENTQYYLYEIWEDQLPFGSLKLSTTDYSKIALALSVRDYDKTEFLLNEQVNRIENVENKLKFQFLQPAVSPDSAIRDKFFESLKNPENRQHEIWVRSALYYLHHPLRAKHSVKYLRETLDMLEEIQQTGDIFFPKNWLAYSIGRYNTREAAAVVDSFLMQNPNYNKNLKSKILQLSDLLHRSNNIRANK